MLWGEGSFGVHADASFELGHLMLWWELQEGSWLWQEKSHFSSIKYSRNSASSGGARVSPLENALLAALTPGAKLCQELEDVRAHQLK